MSHRSTTRRRVALVALLPAMLAMAACSSTVDGTARAGDVAPNAVDRVSYDQVALKETFEETPQEVDKYWEDHDLAGNRSQEFGPNDTSGPKDEAIGEFNPPSTVGANLPEEGSGLGDVSEALPFPMKGLAASTAGQLFYTMGSEAYRCSATVVNSATKDLILTAAHCLFDTSGQDRQVANVLFIPGATDNSGNGPYGRWFGIEMYVPPQFTDTARSGADGLTGEGWAYDFAFLRLAPDENKTLIQDVTGGQGIAFGVPTQSLVAIGYPVEEPYDGSTELYCATTTRNLSASRGYQMSCTMNGGASGGGWLARFDPDKGAGYVVAVSSTAGREPGHASKWIQSMPLGSVAFDTFVKAGGRKS